MSAVGGDGRDGIRSGGPQRFDYPMIDAYGDGGFRFDGERYEGSQLIINGAIAPWDLGAAQADARALSAPAFDAIFAADPQPELILFGCGARMVHPPEPLLARCRETAIGLEVMDTSAACRVYATLVGEGRHIAAALIAV